MEEIKFSEEDEFKMGLFGTSDNPDGVIARALVEIAWQLKLRNEYLEAKL
jgi:hypothetical protein